MPHRLEGAQITPRPTAHIQLSAMAQGAWIIAGSKASDVLLNIRCDRRVAFTKATAFCSNTSGLPTSSPSHFALCHSSQVSSSLLQYLLNKLDSKPLFQALRLSQIQLDQPMICVRLQAACLLDDFPVAFLGGGRAFFAPFFGLCLIVFLFLKNQRRRGVRQLSLFELVMILR